MSTAEALVKFSLQDLDDLSTREEDIYSQRKAAIDKLEDEMEFIEIDRIEAIRDTLITLGTQGSQIRFENPSMASRMIQEEALSVNYKSIDNRRQIIEYATTFRAMNYELHVNFEKSFKVSVEKWRSARFSHVWGIHTFIPYANN